MGHPRLSGLTASTVDGRDEPTTVRLSEFGCLGRPRDNSRPPYPGLSRSSTPSRWSAYPPRRRGWQGPLHGQHLHRAAVAQPEYEEVYLHACASVAEATAGIGNWFRFYNEERQHQNLGYRTPQQTYAAECPWICGRSASPTGYASPASRASAKSGEVLAFAHIPTSPHAQQS